MKKLTVTIPNWLMATMAVAVVALGGRCTFRALEAETGSPVQRRAGTSTSAGAFAEQLAPGPVVGKMLSPNPADTSVTKWIDPPTGLPAGSVNDVPQITATGTTTGWGVTNLSGTTDYIPKKTAGGWGDSAMSESSGYMSLAENFALHNADLATMMIENASDSGLYPRLQTLRQRGTIGSPQPIGAGDYLGLINFLARTSGGYGYSGAYLAAIADNITGGNIVGRMCLNLADGSSADSSAQVWCAYPSYFDIKGGLKVETLDGGGVGKYLYQSSTDGTISAKTLAASDVGAEPTLPVGRPGEVLMTTGTGTATNTNLAWGTGAAYQFSTSTPSTVGSTSGSVGTSTLLSHSDHAHPCRLATSGQDGCMPASDKSKLDGISPGATNSPIGGAAQYVTPGPPINGSTVQAPYYDSRQGLAATNPIQGQFLMAYGTDTKAYLGTSTSTSTSLTMKWTRLPLSYTPAADSVPVLETNKDLGAWIYDADSTHKGLMSITHFNLLYNASATPGVGVIPLGAAGGSGNLNAWVNGPWSIDGCASSDISVGGSNGVDNAVNATEVSFTGSTKVAAYNISYSIVGMGTASYTTPYAVVKYDIGLGYQSNVPNSAAIVSVPETNHLFNLSGLGKLPRSTFGTATTIRFKIYVGHDAGTWATYPSTYPDRFNVCLRASEVLY